MKHLLPLFLIFSFSANTNAVSKKSTRCFSEKNEKPVTPYQAQALASLKKEIADISSPTEAVEILGKLKEQGFSENKINQYFLPEILDTLVFSAGNSLNLKEVIAQGRKVGRDTLKKTVTPYKALQLFFLKSILFSDNGAHVLEKLENSSFSQKEIITIIIELANSPNYRFGKHVISELARGRQIVYETLGRSATPHQALGLALLEEELENSHFSPIIQIFNVLVNELNFSEKDAKSFMDKISYLAAPSNSKPKLSASQELALGILGKLVTPKQDQGLNFLTESRGLYGIRELSITLDKLKEQGFSKDDIKNIFIPIMLDPKFSKDVAGYVAKSQKRLSKNLKREVTSYEAVQFLLINKEFNYVEDTLDKVREYPHNYSILLKEQGFSKDDIKKIMTKSKHHLVEQALL